MKNLIAVLLTSTFAIACGSVVNQSPKGASANLESVSSKILGCVSPDKKTVVIVDRSNSDQPVMRVLYNSKMYFIMDVKLGRQSETQYYLSSSFKNRNGASSTLSLKTYSQDSKTMAEFSELSYLPELPNEAQLSELQCNTK